MSGACKASLRYIYTVHEHGIVDTQTVVSLLLLLLCIIVLLLLFYSKYKSNALELSELR